MKRKWNRGFIAILLALIVVVSAPAPALAAADYADPAAVNYCEESAMPLAEETMWYIRNYNGRVQKRLWSITEGRWLTDWIDC